MGGFEQRLRLEAERRTALLPRELREWKASVDANAKGLGIHQSQTVALDVLITGLVARQTPLLDTLQKAAAGPAFAEAYLGLVDELAGAHDVWRIFRTAIQQHQDPQLSPLLDAADLVAADCYITFMNRVLPFGSTERRAPPLVLLESATSPATVNRGETLGTLRFPLRRYRDLPLTVPLVLLPTDHVECLWLFCSIHHEVGHNIDQDLALEPELKKHLLNRLDDAQVPEERRDRWWEWTKEILADAIGVLLGTAGFAWSLSSWLLLLAPGARFQQIDPSSPHPNPWVRMPLLGALLRTLGTPASVQAADEMAAAYAQVPRPVWVEPFLADLDRVAAVFLNTPLDALGKKTLRELAPAPFPVERLERLTAHLAGQASRPDPNQLGLPHRAVPIAAQLAFQRVDPLDAAALGGLHQRALDFLHALARPQFLAGATVQRTFLEKLVAGLDFHTGRSR